MLVFKERRIDEREIFSLTENSFFKMLNQLESSDPNEYHQWFGKYNINDIAVAPSRLSYTKNFAIKGLFSFDQNTDFHWYSQLYVYTLGIGGKKVLICAYTLMLDDELNIVDDFLS